MKRYEMPMPMQRCGCFALRTGCLIMCIIATSASIANIAVGAWHLKDHKQREPEDNLISMSMVMFSSLSFICNLVKLSGICLKRPSNLQVSVVFNSVFILCILLVTVVHCIFRHGDMFDQPQNVVLVTAALLAGTAFSVYYIKVVNRLYRVMKSSYSQSSIPI